LSSIFCFVTEFLLGLLFNPDDGCNTFLWKVSRFYLTVYNLKGHALQT
jgi:hypothetical protein